MAPVITPAYAACLGVFFVYLSVRTLRLGRKNQIAIGDGGNVSLQRAMRVHANFAEYTPVTILLAGFVESLRYDAVLIHALLLAFTLGRFAHAFGVSKIEEDYRFRVSGMATTFLVIIASSGLIVAAFLR